MFKVKIQGSEPQFAYKLGLGTLLMSLTLQGWVVLATPAVQQIRIEHLAPFFSPNSLTVVPGTTVRWMNDTNEAHTVIADECLGNSSCQFQSGLVQPHASYDLSRLPSGRHSYHCGLHPFMRGTITVLPPKSRRADI